VEPVELDPSTFNIENRPSLVETPKLLFPLLGWVYVNLGDGDRDGGQFFGEDRT